VKRKLHTKELSKELLMSRGITINRPMHRQQTSRCILAVDSEKICGRGKVRFIGAEALKDADNGWVNNLYPTCAHPQCFDGRDRMVIRLPDVESAE